MFIGDQRKMANHETAVERMQRAGGKGANLAEMTDAGMPVPQGFTITTEACTQYYADGRQINDEIIADIFEYVEKLEKITGKKFGDIDNPLLVSVRSGARASMPGMMDTILNLGLNDEAVEGLSSPSSQQPPLCMGLLPPFHPDVRRRCYEARFEEEHFRGDHRRDEGEEGRQERRRPDADDLKELVPFQGGRTRRRGRGFPPRSQGTAHEAVKAVFRSWDNPRANVYRSSTRSPTTGVPPSTSSPWHSATWATTRHRRSLHPRPRHRREEADGRVPDQRPGRGRRGRHPHPQPIAELAEKMPEAYEQFVEEVCNSSGGSFRDMQDMEFTIEDGKLYMLQTRNGKRTAAAALKIACDLVDEGMIDEKTAVCAASPAARHPAPSPVRRRGPEERRGHRQGPRISPARLRPGGLLRRGCQGVVKSGEKVVLVRLETSPEDIEGMLAAAGHPDRRGGMTSHAAVVARGMGKCCVSGCGELRSIQGTYDPRHGKTYHEGDWISLDGSTGSIYAGRSHRAADLAATSAASWAGPTSTRRLKVRANADTPHDAAQAVRASAPRASACAAPSTCSSRATASRPSAR